MAAIRPEDRRRLTLALARPREPAQHDQPVDQPGHEMADGARHEPRRQALIRTLTQIGHGVKVSLPARMAAPPVTATATELPESRVRVDVEVPAAEVERAIERTARTLARDMRLPGFRRGKVPGPVVLRRLGRDAVLDEAVRGRLGAWYTAAIKAAGIAPIGDPDITLDDMPAEGQPLTFKFEVGVRPKAALGEWRGLEVPRREPTVDEDELARQLEQLRERHARLETVDRKAGDADFLVIDYEGSVDGGPIAGGAARDQLVELGSGRLIPGFEEGLRGATAGQERTVAVTFPDDYGNAELAGRDAVFSVTVNEVKEKQLPELDDDLASDAAGFETLDELREDIAKRLRDNDEQRVEREFREAALDAAVAKAQVDVPEALIEVRARDAWERTLHTLGQQGISKEAYLQIADKTEDEVLAEARPDAEQALRREAVIAALIDELALNPTEEQLLESLAEIVGPDEAGRPTDPQDALTALSKAGRLDELREDVAGRLALRELIDAAKPISPGQAAAREKLWTPGS